MDETQLALVEEGLAKLIKLYKQNTKGGDLQKMKAVQDAKLAIRKVILATAIKGDVKKIVPHQETNSTKIGWEVVDQNNRVIRYYA